jgi:hypothetical protein
MPRALTKKRRATTRRWPPSRERLEQLIEEAITDAYKAASAPSLARGPHLAPIGDESEQRTAFFTLIADQLTLPFETRVLDMKVTVEQVKLGAADDIVAICRSGRQRQAIPILDLPLPRPPPAGAEWIEAYRRWVRGR